MTSPDIRNEAAAAYEARKELGSEYEQAVLESFVARAAESIDQRVDARLAELGVRDRPQQPAERADQRSPAKQQEDNSYLAVPVFSVIVGGASTVWLAAISADPAFAFLMWVALAVINVAGRHRRRPS